MFKKLIQIVLAVSSVVIFIGCSNNVASITGQSPTSTALVGYYGASEIGCGGGNAFAVSRDPVDGGYKCYKWNSSSWILFDGGLVRIAADQNGNAWGINSYKQLFQRSGNSWIVWGIRANDVAIGNNGALWIISNESDNGGYKVKRWTGSGWENPSVGGAAERIAVDPSGNPWVVNNVHNLITLQNGAWTQWYVAGLANNANDVGVGSDGVVWVISNIATDGGYTIYKKVGNSLVWVPGGAIAISVKGTNPWVVNTYGNVCELVNGSWVAR